MFRKIFIGATYSAIAFSLISFVSVMVSLLGSVGEPWSKPIANIGFPFTYYFQFWLSGSDSPNCGWVLSSFIYDLLITSFVVFSIYFLVEKRKSNRLRRYWKKSGIHNKFEGLDQEDIRKGIQEGLKKYDKLNFFEKYSMYMGVAQMLELRLKQIMVNNLNEKFENIETWTLGRTLNRLKELGMREDIFLLADPVKDSRNYIAHEIISNELIWHSLVDVPTNHYTKGERTLDKAIFEIEQLMFLVEWNDEYGNW